MYLGMFLILLFVEYLEYSFVLTFQSSSVYGNGTNISCLGGRTAGSVGDWKNGTSQEDIILSGRSAVVAAND